LTHLGSRLCIAALQTKVICTEVDKQSSDFYRVHDARENADGRMIDIGCGAEQGHPLGYREALGGHSPSGGLDPLRAG
jgi:hypothetical protein